MSAWILIATSILTTLLVSLALAEWLSRRITSFASQRQKWITDTVSLADVPRTARRFRDPFAPAPLPGVND